MTDVLFEDAFSLIPIGACVRISDGTPEPSGSGMHYNRWLARNPTGLLVEKQDGPPRAFVVRVGDKHLGQDDAADKGAPKHLAVTTYTVLEKDGLVVTMLEDPDTSELAAQFSKLPKEHPHHIIVPRTGAQLKTITGRDQHSWSKASKRREMAQKRPQDLIKELEERMFKALSILVPDKVAELTPAQKAELFPFLGEES